MGGCSVLGCKNRSHQGFILKRFPKNLTLKKIWANLVQLQEWVPLPHSMVCEVHFEPEMWEKTRIDGTRKLKRDAIPTKFLPGQQTHVETNTEISIQENIKIEITEEEIENESLIASLHRQLKEEDMENKKWKEDVDMLKMKLEEKELESKNANILTNII